MKLRSEGEETSEVKHDKLMQIQRLCVSSVIADPQVRNVISEESLEWMIASIESVGQLSPIRVRQVGEQFVIVDGERRWRAFCKMGLPKIDAVVEESDISEGEVLLKQLIANCQREDLTALEKANGISRLLAVTGWNASQAAAKLGMSNATATRLLALLSLPDAIQQMIASGKIPGSAGYELSQIDDPTRQAELAQELASGAMNRDGVTGARKAAAKGRSGTAVAKSSRVTAILGYGHSVTVSAPSLDLESFIGSLEDVLTRARRVRPQGVELSTFIAMLKDQSRTA